MPLIPDMRRQRLTGLSVDTDALTLTGAAITDPEIPDGAFVPDDERKISIEMKDELRRLPRFGDLPPITASPAKDGTSFGGWSAAVRPVGGDGRSGSRPLAYWISLVNDRTNGKAICRFVAVRVRLLAGGKEIRTIEDGKVDGHECPDAAGMDSGWRLVGAGQPFSFLFTMEAKPGDEQADRLRFTIQAFETSRKFEQPSSAFSIEAILDARAH